MNRKEIELLMGLLETAKYFYKYYPNNFRYTEEEYFEEETAFLEKLESELIFSEKHDTITT